MAMEKLNHISHECELATPKTATDNICNICHKDEAVEFACKSCNFDLCKACSKLPDKVSHSFHPEHTLELCLFKYDRRPKYIICSGCGNMSSGSFYECKTCEIYLDLDCALLKNISEAWNMEEMLDDSHVHLLRRCRPGPEAKGSCLLCELPVSPSSICYGCVYCYSFVHHNCFDLPKEIQHPVHPAHPLKRQSYLRTCGHNVSCNACKMKIVGVPYSCRKCDIDLHLRCADSLLRSLKHKSHEHTLFYVPKGAQNVFGKGKTCQLCMGTEETSLEFYYNCVECDLNFHFECLEIPESLVKKSYHIHPLVCKRFLGEDESLEYCGVCETMVRAGDHVYSCEKCDFLGHIECILPEEKLSPLYLKDLYFCGEDVTKTTKRENHKIIKMETELMVNDWVHIHVMKPIHLSELEKCNICKEKIFGSPYKCTTCSFQTHKFCAELGQPSKTRLLHQNHLLTLLPKSPLRNVRHCDNCKEGINDEFNLFCRICDFIIDISCALKGKRSLGMLGKKVIGEWKGSCINENYHEMVQVIISRSLLAACAICLQKLYGKGLSCMTCEEVYHFQCFISRDELIYDHPFHSNHSLQMTVTSGAECIACKMNIAKHGYNCSKCSISFHIECIKSVNTSRKMKPHTHYFYNFWNNDSRLNQACGVCARPCGASFYGCVDCNFIAHVKCLGIAENVRSQRHQHSVVDSYAFNRRCSHCASNFFGYSYTCNHCGDLFHRECLMPLDDREAATEEEQLCDIYLMYLERDLSTFLEDYESLFDSDSISELSSTSSLI